MVRVGVGVWSWCDWGRGAFAILRLCVEILGKGARSFFLRGTGPGEVGWGGAGGFGNMGSP